MTHRCYACRLTYEEESCPGGTLLDTKHWIVQHSTGPLPVGTLIVKPRRHCVHIAELRPAEATELGPLLQRVSRVVQKLTAADQVYACLWSHRDWTAGHIHFVVQPAWASQRESFPKPGPMMQARMFESGEPPSMSEVLAFCERAKRAFAWPPVDEPTIH